MRQHHAVYIGDFATNGRCGNQRDAVGGGLGNVFVVLIHLQKHKPRRQDAEKDKNKNERRHQTPNKIALAVVGGLRKAA